MPKTQEQDATERKEVERKQDRDKTRQAFRETMTKIGVEPGDTLAGLKPEIVRPELVPGVGSIYAATKRLMSRKQIDARYRKLTF